MTEYKVQVRTFDNDWYDWGNYWTNDDIDIEEVLVRQNKNYGGPDVEFRVVSREVTSWEPVLTDQIRGVKI